MAVWKLRDGKAPPPDWMADLLAYLERAHGVKPSRELVAQLYPVIVAQWQEGATVRETGKATCSCEKGKIVPSPAARVQLSRGDLKPPRGAKRGDVFGFDELRARGTREKQGLKSEPTPAPPVTPKATKPRLPRAPREASPKRMPTASQPAKQETPPPPAAQPAKKAPERIVPDVMADSLVNDLNELARKS